MRVVVVIEGNALSEVYCSDDAAQVVEVDLDRLRSRGFGDDECREILQHAIAGMESAELLQVD